MVFSSSSGMLLWPFTDESRSFAHVIGLRRGTLDATLNLHIEVEKPLRHVCMAYPDVDGIVSTLKVVVVER
jgi:hypothetical protein